MALNLNQIKNGMSSQSCGSDQPISQKIQIVPYSSTANCQSSDGIEASKQTVGITVKNMIVDACGVIRIHFDNSATGAVDRVVAFGGPINAGNRAALAIWYPRWDGFTTIAALSHIVDGPTTPAGTTDGYFWGNLILNEFVGNQNAIVVTNLSIVRADLSDAPTLELSNNAIRGFWVDDSSTYNVETSGGTIYASQTSVGSGNTSVDLQWCLGAGIPLTQTTGFELTIPAGFVGDLEVCVGAAQKNIDFAEGC